MVKNTKGGSGHKSQARKFASGSIKTTNKATRFSQDEFEYYAQVVATLGNGMCHVACKDGKKRLCHIRGKFRGRGMRDNMVKNGVWVLVGGRDFEAERTKDDKKLENCDLLEVYSDLDKERLKTLGGFSDFIARDHTFTNTAGQADDELEFTDNATENEYFNLMKQNVPERDINSSSPTAIIEDDEVNVDDI
jgi:translation initiation factor 1A